MKKNLALTGMMGVGKTSVGKLLSKKLSIRFIDVDKVIENKFNISINEIFEKKGEKFFRKLEEKVTLQQLKKNNVIISLGGGAFINPKIRREVLLTCKSFWLNLDIQTLQNRLIRSKNRPLLANQDLKATLKKLFKEREKIYALADFKIDCKSLTINSITKKIIKLYANN